MLWARYSSGFLGVCAFVALSLQSSVGLLESVGDVLEEDEPEDDMLVFGGVDATPQGIGRFPQLGFVPRGSSVAIDLGLRVLASLCDHLVCSFGLTPILLAQA